MTTFVIIDNFHVEFAFVLLTTLVPQKTRCMRGVRVVFSVTRMLSSNSARINKFDFRTEKIV